jgi:hypothetical protein
LPAIGQGSSLSAVAVLTWTFQAECLKVHEREAALPDFAINKDFRLETLRKRPLGT